VFITTFLSNMSILLEVCKVFLLAHLGICDFFRF
jgi:hypothetical protein